MRPVGKIFTTAGSMAFELLLGIGFVASIILLVVHIINEDHPDLAIIGEFMLVAVLALEGIVAVRHLRQSQLDSLHVLFQLLEDFRTPEMTIALVSLWRFKQRHGEKFVEVYMDTWHKDVERIAALPGEEQVEAMHATLHYRRRAVKEFYNRLAGMYELGVLPRKVIYTYWGEAELRIIPEILMPLEKAVATELRTEQNLGDWFKRLQRLYDDKPAV